MSQLGDRIAATEQWVVDYEAERYGQEVLEQSMPPLWSDQPPLKFAANLYAGFRPIEAVAYHQRGEVVTRSSTERAVRWARDQEPLIRGQLERLEGFQPKDEWQEAGKLFVERTLRWGLGRLEAFKTWGY
jgi:hypothetical protein